MSYLSITGSEKRQTIINKFISVATESVSKHLNIPKKSIAYEVLDYLLRHPGQAVSSVTLFREYQKGRTTFTLSYPLRTLHDGLQLLRSRFAKTPKSSSGNALFPFTIVPVDNDLEGVVLHMTQSFEDWEEVRPKGNYRYYPTQRPALGTSVDSNTFDAAALHQMRRIANAVALATAQEHPLPRAPQGIDW